MYFQQMVLKPLKIGVFKKRKEKSQSLVTHHIPKLAQNRIQTYVTSKTREVLGEKWENLSDSGVSKDFFKNI